MKPHVPCSDVAGRFIPLRLAQPEAPGAPAEIIRDFTIELQHDDLKASVRWPVSQAPQCAAWLREVMR